MVRAFSAIEPQDLQPLWPNRLYRGKATILAGDPGRGKSSVTCDLAARVSTGRAWPDRAPGGDPGDVLMVSAEDTPEDVVVHRLIAAGADLGRVYVLDGVRTEGRERPVGSLEEDLLAIDAALAGLERPMLLVIDPMSAFVGARDSYRNSDMRALLHPLTDMAARRGVAVVLVEHLSKDAKRKGLYRVGGSIGVVGAARSAFFVVDDREDDGRRLLLEAKNNYGRSDGLAFRVESSVKNPAAPVVVWEPEPVTVTLDEALRPPDTGDRATGTAGDWLRTRWDRGGTASEMATSGPRQYRGDPEASERALALLLMGARPEARVLVGQRGARRYFHADVPDRPVDGLDVDGVSAAQGAQEPPSPSTSTASTPTLPLGADPDHPPKGWAYLGNERWMGPGGVRLRQGAQEAAR